MLGLARSGMTMLIVTHEMQFARAVADKIVFIDGGEVVEESANPDTFFSNPATDRARRFLNVFQFER
jgi:polar amino acid transport system ATP-binding protein